MGSAPCRSRSSTTLRCPPAQASDSTAWSLVDVCWLTSAPDDHKTTHTSTASQQHTQITSRCCQQVSPTNMIGRQQLRCHVHDVTTNMRCGEVYLHSAGTGRYTDVQLGRPSSGESDHLLTCETRNTPTSSQQTPHSTITGASSNTTTVAPQPKATGNSEHTTRADSI